MSKSKKKLISVIVSFALVCSVCLPHTGIKLWGGVDNGSAQAQESPSTCQTDDVSDNQSSNEENASAADSGTSTSKESEESRELTDEKSKSEESADDTTAKTDSIDSNKNQSSDDTNAAQVTNDTTAPATAVVPTQWTDMPEKSEDEADALKNLLLEENNVCNNSNDVTIKSTSATWTAINDVEVPEAQKTNAQVTATSNTTQKEKFTYKYELNGAQDFEVGSIQIKVPAKIWTTRDGNLIGDMNLSVPADPSTADTYSYTYDSDNNQYIITNVKKVAKTSAGFMQFTIKHLPAEIADGATSSNLEIKMTVAANGDNPVETVTSAPITATIDTSEKIDSVSENTGNVYITVDEAKNNGLSEGEIRKLTDPDDYIFVRFFSTVKVKGCKPFNIKAASSVDSKYASGVMLESGDTPQTSVTKDVFTGYINDGLSKDVYMWSAYPKSNFGGVNTSYRIDNSVKWDLTEQEEPSQTGTIGTDTRTSSARATYVTPRKITVSLEWKSNGHDDLIPEDHEVYVYRYNATTYRSELFKTLTLTKEGGWNSIIEDSEQGSFSYWMSEKSPIAWFYNTSHDFQDASIKLTNTYYEPGETYPPSSDNFSVYALDHNYATIWDYSDNDTYKLSVGKDVATNFSYSSSAVGSEYTFNEGTEGAHEFYSQIYANKFSANGTTLGTGDYQISSITLNNPTTYTAYKLEDERTKATAGMPWGYNEDATSHPTINLYGAKSDGTYILLATATYKDNAYVYETFNGASASGNTITMPDGILYAKQEASTNNAKIDLSMKVSIKIFADGAVGTMAKNLLSTTDDTVIKFAGNGQASLLNYYKEVKQASSNYSTSYLHGHNPKVEAKSTLKFGDPSYDTEKKITTVWLTQTVTEQSNIALADMYNELVSDGTIPNDSKGVSTFYSLLPLGMHADTSTVSLQSGDSITDTQVISNFRDSGRDMLIVKANLGRHVSQTYNESHSAIGYKSVQKLTYQAKMSYFDTNVYGKEVTANNVFEGGDEIVGTKTNYKGEPDDPTYGNNVESQSATEGVTALLKNLDSTTDKESFLYSKGTKTLNPDLSGLSNLKKTVYADGKDKDDTDKTIKAGQGYTYQIDFTATNKSTDMVFIDMLENVAGTSSFNGTFDYIDVSGIKASGIDAKVYYRTDTVAETIGLYTVNSDCDYVDSAGKKEGEEGFTSWQVKDGWTTEMPTDKSTIKGIAIDATHGTDGNPVTLEENNSISTKIHMIAPDGTRLVDKSTAQNEVYLHYKLNGQPYKGAAAQKTNDPTTLTALEHSITVKAQFDDDENRDGVRPNEVTAKLFANGEDTGKTVILSADSGYEAAFSKLDYAKDGEKIEYSVQASVDKYTSSTKFTDEENLSLKLTHDPEKIDVSGSIVWVDDNENIRPTSANINLMNGTTKVTTQTVNTVEGTDAWEFTFTNVYKYQNQGQEISYTATQENTFKDYITSALGLTITNKYYPYGDVEIKNTLVDTTFVSSLKIFDYTLELYNADETAMIEGTYKYKKSDGSTGSIATNGNFTLGDGQTITIEDLPSDCRYKVIQANKDGFTAANETLSSTVIGAKNKVNSEFVNVYAASATLASYGSVGITGTSLEPYAFLFNLSQGSEVLKSAINSATGEFKFYLDYTQKDVAETEHEYTISQADRRRSGYTYDNATYTLKVKVEDNGDGTLRVTPKYYKDGTEVTSPTFTNAYSATGKISLGAYTTLQGGSLTADKFTFDLSSLSDDGTPTKLNTEKNDAAGTITFPDITYYQDAAHSDVGKTYKYLIKQDQTAIEGYVLSSEYYAFAVTITDNGDGTLNADSTQYPVKKTDDGKYVEDTSTTDVPQPIFHNKVVDGKLSLTQRIQGDDNYAQEFAYHVALSGDNVPEDGNYSFTKERVTSESENQYDEDSLAADKQDSEDDLSNNHSDNETTSLSNNGESNETANYAVYYSGGYLVFQNGTGDKFSTAYGNVAASYEASEWETGFTDTTTNIPWNANIDNIKCVDFYGTTNYKQTKYYGLLFGLKNMQEIKNIDNLKVDDSTSLSNMFAGCASLTSVDVSAFSTANVTNLNGMFSDCKSLQSLDLSNWTDASKVTSATELFRYCSSLQSIDLSSIPNANETSGQYMFDSCSSLNSITLGGSFTTLKGTGLATPTDKGYTGYWKNKNVTDPQTTEDLVSNYTTAWAGTWDALEKSYTLKFKSGDFTSLGTMPDVTTNTGLAYTLPANKFYVFNKVFAGWKDSSDPAYEYSDKDTIPAERYSDGSEITLTAQWKDADNTVKIKDGCFDIVLHQNEKATFDNIPAGTNYQIYQKIPNGWKLISASYCSADQANTLNDDNAITNNVVGTVASNAESAVTFTDEATTEKSVTDTDKLITSKVTFNGEDAESGAFQFELFDSAGAQIANAYNGEGGVITFSPITYTYAGTYTYKIKQIEGSKTSIKYDKSEITVTVVVSEDSTTGALSVGTPTYTPTTNTFNNTGTKYPTNTLTLSDNTANTVGGSKTQSFDYTLSYFDPSTKVTTTQDFSVKRGETLSPAITLNQGTTYTITPKSLPAGWSTSATDKLTGTIGSDPTTATITHAYSATGTAQIEANVALTGGTFKEGDFTLQLQPQPSVTSEIITNSAPDTREKILDNTGAEIVNPNFNVATATFAQKTYTTPGTYTYEITETKGPDSVTISTDKFIATVTVTDNNNGTLSTNVAYTKDGATVSEAKFTNEVITSTGTLAITNVTNGAVSTAAKAVNLIVNVVLTDANGNALSGSYKYYSDIECTQEVGIIISGGAFSLPQGKTYYIKDLPTGTKYELSQTMANGFSQTNAENVSGTIAKETGIAAKFTNSYATSGDVTLVGTVKTNDAAGAQVTLTGDEYSFNLTDENGSQIQEAYNDKDGKFSFVAICYTQANITQETNDILTYHIYQNDLGDPAVKTYDSSTYTVAVTLEDKGDGTITTTATYTKDSAEADSPEGAEDANSADFVNELNAKYTVTHQVQKADKSGYDTISEEIKYAAANTSVTPDVLNLPGYTTPSTQTTTVNADGTTQVTYQYNKNDTASYAVNHFKQRQDKSGYDLQEGEKINAEAGTTATPATKTYEGYTAPPTQSVLVLADNSAVVDYYYDINSHAVTFDVQGHGTAPSKIESQAYGTKITKPSDPSEAGYTFGGWYKDAKCTTTWDFDKDTMPNNDLILYAKWTANPDTPYIVNHWKLNADGTRPASVSETETLTGTTDTQTAAVAKTYDGYTDKAFQQQNIKGDGSTVVDIEYSLNVYKVTFDVQGHGSTPSSVDVQYTQKVNKPTDPTEVGYTFGGWYKDVNCTAAWDFDKDTMPANDLTLYAKWTAIPDDPHGDDPSVGNNLSNQSGTSSTSDNNASIVLMSILIVAISAGAIAISRRKYKRH